MNSIVIKTESVYSFVLFSNSIFSILFFTHIRKNGVTWIKKNERLFTTFNCCFFWMDGSILVIYLLSVIQFICNFILASSLSRSVLILTRNIQGANIEMTAHLQRYSLSNHLCLHSYLCRVYVRGFL